MPKTPAAVAPTGMSLRQFAERVGCSHTLVQKAVRKGLLIAGVARDAKRRPSIVDADAAELQWRTAKLGELKATPEVTLIEAQTRSALELARQRRIANRQRRGELIEARAVRRESFKVLRIARDNILNVPARIAAGLAAETDARRVQNMLEAELRQALTVLADKLAALAADSSDTDDEAA